MVFSEEQSMLVLGEVSNRLHLSEDIVKRTLHSLSCGKFKVLKRDGEGASIRPTDKVCSRFVFRVSRVSIVWVFVCHSTCTYRTSTTSL